MNHFIESTSKILLRDLDKLEKEISLYPTLNSLWEVRGEIKNPGGNLCLHLCGNLQHFIGAILGNSGYVRNREKEFSLTGLSTKDLVREVITTKEAIKNAMAKMDPAQLEKNYPILVFEEPMTTMYFLIHLTAHLEYHLGQINYHRRLLSH
jgi:uncharacterized damage-inducible protein DinB